MSYPQSKFDPGGVFVSEREWDSVLRVMKLIYDWCHDGTLTPEQVEQISVTYNGRKPDAKA